ncbi:hypothetical protein [Dactylosporangium darangshiense]|uniref:Uncharacterized protein n=1 Tax=Dactylosporangium darangshiense TaxID=579108 RepID=A0ABP8DUA9_9ACTN
MTPRRSLGRRLLPWILVIGVAAWIIVIVVLITMNPAGSAG